MPELCQRSILTFFLHVRFPCDFFAGEGWKFARKDSPCRGIEPRSPAWQAGILTTILTRMLNNCHSLFSGQISNKFQFESTLDRLGMRNRSYSIEDDLIGDNLKLLISDNSWQKFKSELATLLTLTRKLTSKMFTWAFSRLLLMENLTYLTIVYTVMGLLFILDSNSGVEKFRVL